MKKTKLQEYEVGIAVTEIWLFRVRARNRKEAYRVASGNDRTDENDLDQIGTISGNRSFVRRLGK